MTEYYFLILFHVLGATIWVGGHLVLAIGYLPEALKKKSVTDLQIFESKFERIGIPALLVQIVTGLRLALIREPDWHQWFDHSNPNHGIGLKLILLLATALLAVDARLRVIPKLNSENIKSLAWHIIPVTVIAVIFVVIGTSFKVGGF